MTNLEIDTAGNCNLTCGCGQCTYEDLCNDTGCWEQGGTEIHVETTSDDLDGPEVLVTLTPPVGEVRIALRGGTFTDLVLFYDPFCDAPLVAALDVAGEIDARRAEEWENLIQARIEIDARDALMRQELVQARIAATEATWYRQAVRA